MFPIVTISGIPTFTYEWQELENSIDCVWINFIIPGLDGMEQKRGTFTGNV